jgi:hypothetical protein
MGSGSECGCRKEGGWEDGCVVSQCFEETDNFACAGCHFCEFFCRWLDMWIGGLEYGIMICKFIKRSTVLDDLPNNIFFAQPIIPCYPL